MESPFVYPIILLIGSILMIVTSAYDIGTGKDEKEHITKNGTNLSVVGGCLGFILFVISVIWILGLAIAAIIAN